MFSAESVENQAVRIHDFKVYGELPEDPGSVTNNMARSFNFTFSNNIISVSEEADVFVYEMSGKLVKKACNVRTLSLSDVPDGIWIVKAKNDRKSASIKIVKL